MFSGDQGSQFTSEVSTSALKVNSAKISMGGRARSFDNIFTEPVWCAAKNEDVYLKGSATMDVLLIGLTHYPDCHYGERPHQALNNQTPDAVRRSGTVGGPLIIDRHPRTKLRVLRLTPQHQFKNQGNVRGCNSHGMHNSS